MNYQWRGIILILVSAVSFGLMPIFARLAYEVGVGVQELLFVRFVLAVLTIGIVLGLTRRFTIPSRSKLLVLLGLGGIGYFFGGSLYFIAIQYIPVSVAAPILYTYPAFVTASSLALGWEMPSVPITLSLLLALFGLALLTNPLSNVHILGVLTALGASITYTVYILISTQALKGMNGLTASFHVMGAAGLSFGISGTLTGDLQLRWSLEAWFWVIMISMISTSLAITTFLQGLKMIGPARASLLSVAEPATSMVRAYIAFEELLSTTQWIGSMLILLAAIFAALSKTPEKKKF